MASRKKYLVLLLVIVGLVVFYYWKNPLSVKLKIRDQVFLVDIAVTPKQRERGLSGRQSLGKNRGMLFLFGTPGAYHFWMHGMLIPLDFIWIQEDKIVALNEHIPAPKPGEAPIELSVKEPVDKVLEVNAGTINQYKISVGDKVEFVK